MIIIVACAKDLWDELNGHYGFEDEGAKKFATAKFMSFQMVEEKSISSQIEDFQKLISNLAKEGDILPWEVCGSWPCV